MMESIQNQSLHCYYCITIAVPVLGQYFKGE